jgi:hypothetical protein
MTGLLKREILAFPPMTRPGCVMDGAPYFRANWDATIRLRPMDEAHARADRQAGLGTWTCYPQQEDPGFVWSFAFHLECDSRSSADAVAE